MTDGTGGRFKDGRGDQKWAYLVKCDIVGVRVRFGVNLCYQGSFRVKVKG